MKSARFDYHIAGTIDEVLAMLAETDSSLRLIAGGQSLGPMLNLRLARPRALLDISGIAELRGVTRSGDRIRIGATVTHAEIEDGEFAPLVGHPMQVVAADIAYRAIRNRGTIGGSLAHADPAADWVLACAAMGARAEIMGPGGKIRMAKIEELMVGAYTTTVSAVEIIVAVHVPVIPPEARWGFYKFCRKVGEFAEASAAALFDPGSRAANVLIGATAGCPVSLPETALVCARSGLEQLSDQTINSDLAKVLPDSDRADHHLYVSVVRRALDQAFDRRRLS